MRKARFLSVLLCISILANLIFVGSGALYMFYVRKHGGVQRFVELFTAPAPIALNGTIDSLVRKSLFKTLETPSVASPTVFLGDSVTEFCEWSELLGAPVLNRGISSDTTVDILDRLDPVLALHPKTIFLMIGLNDAVQRSSAADAAERYRKILQAIREESPTTRIYIESLLPVRSTGSLVQSLGPDRAPRLNEWVQDMNRRISSYADGKTIFYINIHDDMLENGELASCYTVDGIHLSGAGYAAWKQRVVPFLSAP